MIYKVQVSKVETNLQLGYSVLDIIIVTSNIFIINDRLVSSEILEDYKGYRRNGCPKYCALSSICLHMRQSPCSILNSVAGTLRKSGPLSNPIDEKERNEIIHFLDEYPIGFNMTVFKEIRLTLFINVYIRKEIRDKNIEFYEL